MGTFYVTFINVTAIFLNFFSSLQDRALSVKVLAGQKVNDLQGSDNCYLITCSSFVIERLYCNSCLKNLTPYCCLQVL